MSSYLAEPVASLRRFSVRLKNRRSKMAQPETGKLLRLEAVISLIGMKRSWILQKVKDGKFPKPLRLSPRAVAWREREILEWIESCELGD